MEVSPPLAEGTPSRTGVRPEARPESRAATFRDPPNHRGRQPPIEPRPPEGGATMSEPGIDPRTSNSGAPAIG